MDLSTLEKEWKVHPTMKFLAFPSVNELSKHLVKVHRSLLLGEHTVFGYLYQKQVERNKQLRKELEECKQTKNK